MAKASQAEVQKLLNQHAKLKKTIEMYLQTVQKVSEKEYPHIKGEKLDLWQTKNQLINMVHNFTSNDIEHALEEIKNPGSHPNFTRWGIGGIG